MTSSSYPCLIPFYYLLALADEERTCVAELKEFQFTYTACYSAVTHPIKPMVLNRNIEPVSLNQPSPWRPPSRLHIEQHNGSPPHISEAAEGYTSRIIDETPRSELAKNNTKHICKTEVTNTAHVHNITHILHLLIGPRFHQPMEATTILRKTTILLGPYRRPEENWPNIQVTVKPNSFTR